MKSFMFFMSIVCLLLAGLTNSAVSQTATSSNTVEETICGVYSLEEYYNNNNELAKPPHLKGLWILGGGVVMVILQSDEGVTWWGADSKLTFISIGTYTLDLNASTFTLSYDEEFVFKETPSATTRVNMALLGTTTYSITSQDSKVHGISDNDKKSELLFDNNGCTVSEGGRILQVYKRNTTSQTKVAFSLSDIIPATLSLGQNYPNPFNPTTTIDYSVPNSGDVFLAIYNAKGQLVQTLVDEIKPAGDYTTNWKGNDIYGNFVSSGTYFYKLRVNGHETAKKMLKVK